MPCCLFVSDEEADGEIHNCETCAVADMLADLDDDPDNAEAWALFHRTFTRFTVDTHVASVLLTKLISEREPSEALELVDRFAVLYDALHPPPEKKE